MLEGCKTVLEAGCGVGAQTVTLAKQSPNARIVSMDVSEASLAVAPGSVNASFPVAIVFSAAGASMMKGSHRGPANTRTPPAWPPRSSFTCVEIVSPVGSQHVPSWSGPLALGIGPGAELQKPLALAVIGGLSVSTVVTLVFVPATMSLLGDGR